MQEDLAFDAVQDELEEPGHNENWDFENPVLMPARSARTSVFSVRFESTELGEVRRAADATGVTTGEFIRRAALAAAREHREPGTSPTAFEALVDAVAEKLEQRRAG